MASGIRAVKLLLIITITANCLSNSYTLSEELPCYNQNSTYQVIKVIDPDTFYIDFNGDRKAQQNEKVRINGADGFAYKPGKECQRQMSKFKLTQKEVLGLGYFGKKFAERELLNKYVQVKATADRESDVYNRHLVSIYYSKNNKNTSYEKELLKSGLAVIYPTSNIAKELSAYENKIRLGKNIIRSRLLDLVVLNRKSGKYHSVDCPFGLKSEYYELIDRKALGYFYEPAGCCLINEHGPAVILNNYNYNSMIEGDVRLFFVNPLKYRRPQEGCVNDSCASLLSLIKDSKNSINFAIYGISGQPEILAALKAAQNRGVKVYGIVDKDIYNVNIYKDTESLINTLKTVHTDYDEDIKSKQKELERLKKYNKKDPTKDFDIRSAIMHDKFFVIDDSYVWTGSTNTTENCMSYNANVSALIKSKQIAELYNKEFNQMYFDGKYHKSKSKNSLQNENLILSDTTKISVYFSPQDRPLSTKVMPLIDAAQNYIFVPIFYLTHKGVIERLIAAHNRGVDVKVIIDANSAHNQFSKHNLLRKNHIPVKAENWGGKMHMKTAIIDDKYIIVASMNWTASAESTNDENTLIVENQQLASYFKGEFLALWESIPSKWLKKDPGAESPDSINSCFDGVDNNHNGLFDSDEPACQKAIFGRGDTYYRRHYNR